MFKFLFRDFLDQRWPIKLFTLWGWLAIVIMLCALGSPYVQATLDPENFEHIFDSE